MCRLSKRRGKDSSAGGGKGEGGQKVLFIRIVMQILITMIMTMIINMTIMMMTMVTIREAVP